MVLPTPVDPAARLRRTVPFEVGGASKRPELTPDRGPGRSAARRWALAAVVVGVAAGITIWHATVVGRHYYIGSFDDDANYILTAKALLGGQGLTGHLTGGAVVIGAYPPGFPSLLVPLLALWPHTYQPLRVLSATCATALLPLTWYYLGRRRVPDPVRIAVMALLALNVVLATFATMVMAEPPFLLMFLGLLLAEEWWEARAPWSAAGLVTVLAAAGVVWLKEASIGMVAGLVLWLLLRRETRRALLVAGGVLALLLPVVIGRAIAGVPFAGARYSQELGGYYSGGLANRLFHVVPSGVYHFFATALPNTLVPLGSPIPYRGAWIQWAEVLAWQVPLFTVIGFVVWVRRHRDASVLIVPVYAAEVVLWPYVNERRVVLALPLFAAWYALGLWFSGGWLVRRVRQVPLQALAGTGLCVLLAGLVVTPLVVQFHRDYLFANHQSSSHPIGSRYAAMLSAVGSPGEVVETDYLSTTALISGHLTANSAFVAINGAIAQDPGVCSEATVTTELAKDDAGFLLTAALNHPFVMNSPCILSEATTHTWAVRLMRTSRDLASVFELIGPGTGHPSLVDATADAVVTTSGPLQLAPIRPSAAGDQAGDAVATMSEDNQGVLTWTWSHPARVTQVSVGEAGATGGCHGVVVQLLGPTGHWTTVARSPGTVGDGPQSTAFLLASWPGGYDATAVRVVITGSGQLAASDVHALANGAAAVSRAVAWVRARPLARRIAGYGAGSVVAAATSELAFAVTLYFGHTGTAAASAAGFVGGAIPNYFLNRRWAWTDRRGRSRRTEVLLYTAVAVASFVASVVVTGYVEHWARHQTADRRWSVLLAAAAYLAVSGAFFAVKFVLYELVVFKEADGPEAPAPPPGAAPTMSTR